VGTRGAGNDGRRFPVETSPDPSRLNYSESRVGHATPVGVYPLGATPDGVQDMAAKRWEWCQDWYAEDSYAKIPATNPTGPQEGDRRVVRGGSWGGGAGGARSATRVRFIPDDRLGGIGFRVVLDVAPRTA
jgi:formylglycine-generating enzyme required for sulfatase activity